MKQPLHILHLEDNPNDAELVRSLLEAEGIDCEVTCVRTREAYEAELERGVFDLLLTDFSLPRFDGLAALELARQKHPDKPTIVLSGTMGEDVAVKCLQQGATDYVLKDRLARLPSAVRRAVAESRVLEMRQEAEAKIREQAALLDKAQDAIMVRDMEDRILYWNRSAEQLYGWRSEDVVGRDAREIFWADSSPQHEEARRQAVEQGEWKGEMRQLTRAGKTVVVESRWTLLRDKSGAPKAKLIINTDVTERKKLEAQLLRAQRLETIGALSGGIAHDLNNVLAPILVGIQLLKQKQTPRKRQKILDTMQARATRGSEMVQQILAFARGVGGGPAVLKPRQLVAEVEKLARETFPRTIHIQVKAEEGLHSVMGNATQLHQVLLNLCVNARDAMPEGGSLVLSADNVVLDKTTTRWHPEPASGLYVMLSVLDTGHGIPLELLDRIFEPFFTTKEVGKGTGLGLSTVLGIVKSHAGFLDVSSEVGTGTTFKVYLPAHMVNGTKVS